MDPEPAPRAEPATKNARNYFDEVFIPPDTPEGSRLRDVHIIASELERVKTFSPFKQWNLLTAHEVLKNPDRIYRHIRDGDDHWGWCFAARVPSLRRDDGTLRSMHPDQVFAVYMNEEASVFEWRPERCDQHDRFAPARSVVETTKEGLGRFGSQIWMKPGTA
jgi:hypothetical protein